MTDTNLATLVSGFGAVANAYGAYETGKKKNKIAQQQLDYEKQKDLAANLKMDTAQSNLEDAFSASTLGKKKKKNPDGTDVVEDTTALIV